MRLPNRGVGDYDVDRREAQRRRRQSRPVLIPRNLSRASERAPSGDLSSDIIAAAEESGTHLYPFRTEKLSPSSPMVLAHQLGE